MSIAERARVSSIRLLAAAGAVAVAASLAGCSYTTQEPCVVGGSITPAVDGAVSFKGTPGAFDLPATSANGTVSLRIVQSPDSVDAHAGPYDLDVLASSDGASARSYWVHVNGIPTAPGTYDLAALGAKACYCPDAAPIGDYSGDAQVWGGGGFGGPTQQCSRADGTRATDVTPACESLSGSLTIASFAVDCARPGEINDTGADCALAFEATVDVPKSATNVYFSVHGVQQGMTHSTCDIQHSYGPDLGIGFVPN